MRALEKEPDLRFQQVSEFKTGFQAVSDTSAMPFFGRASSDQQLAIRIVKFVGFSAGITFAIIGVLFLVLSSTDELINEDVAKTIGFSGMAIGGLICALLGIFLAVFDESPEAKGEPKKPAENEEEEEDEQPMPTSVLLIKGVAMFLMFCGGLFFIAGSGQFGFLDRDPSRFLGIASIMMGAFLFVIGGMVAKAKGYKEK